jgi:glycerol-3-phosphate responsive antiterminator
MVSFNKSSKAEIVLKPFFLFSILIMTIGHHFKITNRNKKKLFLKIDLMKDVFWETIEGKKQ